MLTPEELDDLPADRQTAYVYRQVRDIALWVSGNGRPEDGARRVLMDLRADMKKLLIERSWPVWKRIAVRVAEQIAVVFVLALLVIVAPGLTALIGQAAAIAIGGAR